METVGTDEIRAEVGGQRRGVAGVGGEEPLFHGVIRKIFEAEPGLNVDVVRATWKVHRERTKRIRSVRRGEPDVLGEGHRVIRARAGCVRTVDARRRRRSGRLGAGVIT